MNRPVSAVKMAGLRELRTGEAPTFTRLAAVSGLNASTIRERARVEGWPSRNYRKKRREWSDGRATGGTADGVRDELAAEAAEDGSEAEGGAPPGRSRQELLASAVSRQVEGVLLDAESGRLDKGQIDAVMAMIRMAGEATQVAPAKTEETKKTRSDEQLAETMRLIDERIVELALGLAERMGVQVDRS